MDAIKAEFKYLEELGAFQKNDLKTRADARIQFERQLWESTPPQLEVLNGYIEHLHKHLIYVRNRLVKLELSDQPHPYLGGHLKKIKIMHELRINHYSQDQDDDSFLADYLRFCKDCNKISDAKEFLIKEHPINVNIWMTTATILANDLNEEKAAVDFLIAATHYIKHNEYIYKRILHIELTAASNSSKQAFVDKCIEGLTDVLENQIKEDHSVEFSKGILTLICEYTFTRSLQKVYVELMVTKFSYSADIWHYVAQNELQENEVKKCGKVNQTDLVISDASKFADCVKLYERGVVSVSDADKPRLWFMYIDFIITITLDRASKYDLVTRVETCKNAIQNGHSFISEEQYLKWFERLNKEDSKDIVALAVNVHPYSEKLWRARMYYESYKGDVEPLNTVFHQARAILQENSYLHWDFFITFHQCWSDQDTIRSFYEEGLRQHPNIAQKLKPDYLNWLAQTESINAARELYLRIGSEAPFCKELHNTMLKLEDFQAITNLEAIERAYNLAFSQFKNDRDLKRSYKEFKENSHLRQT